MRDCELCEAARFTHWYHADQDGWVADCEACDCPMVVWTGHGTDPPADVRDHLLTVLATAADGRFGPGRWRLDPVMRQVPDHFHAHARDAGWATRRWASPPSRYTVVGGTRETG